MGLKEFLIDWIFKNVRIKTDVLKNMLDDCDIDKDGYIAVGEFVEVLKILVKR